MLYVSKKWMFWEPELITRWSNVGSKVKTRNKTKNLRWPAHFLAYPAWSTKSLRTWNWPFRNRGFTHEKSWCSIANCWFTRGFVSKLSNVGVPFFSPKTIEKTIEKTIGIRVDQLVTRGSPVSKAKIVLDQRREFHWPPLQWIPQEIWIIRIYKRPGKHTYIAMAKMAHLEIVDLAS